MNFERKSGRVGGGGVISDPKRFIAGFFILNIHFVLDFGHNCPKGGVEGHYQSQNYHCKLRYIEAYLRKINNKKFSK